MLLPRRRLEGTTSQEVRHSRRVRRVALLCAYRRKNQIFTLHVFVDVQDGGDVSALVEIVRSRPNRDEALVFEPILEAIHNKLVGARHEFQAVDMVELRSDSAAEDPACTSGGHGPRLNVVWVRPHQI